MDYTPVTFSAAGRVTSAAAQLAQSIVYESGLQHYADSPGSYGAPRRRRSSCCARSPPPGTTRGCWRARPARSVTLARRSGERWFVGSLSATAARSGDRRPRLPARGPRLHRAHLRRRGQDGIAVTERRVDASTRLTLALARHGGFAIVADRPPDRATVGAVRSRSRMNARLGAGLLVAARRRPRARDLARRGGAGPGGRAAGRLRLRRAVLPRARAARSPRRASSASPACASTSSGRGVVRRPKGRKAPRAQYDWAAYDSLIADAARHGIRLQMTFTGPAPAWATSNRQGRRARRARGAVRAVRARRGQALQGPRGPLLDLERAELAHPARADQATCRKNHWGKRLRRRASAALYRALYVAGHRAVKAVDPQAQVLFGELAPQASGTPREPTAYASSPLAILREITCSKRSWKAARRCPRLRRGRLRPAPLRLHAPRPTRSSGARTTSRWPRSTGSRRALDRLAARGALRTPSGAPMELYLTEHGYMQSGRADAARDHPRRLPHAELRPALAHPRVRQLLQYLLTAPPPRQTSSRRRSSTTTGRRPTASARSRTGRRSTRRASPGRVSASLLTSARRRRRGATRPPRGARGSRARARRRRAARTAARARSARR